MTCEWKFVTPAPRQNMTPNASNKANSTVFGAFLSYSCLVCGGGVSKWFPSLWRNSLAVANATALCAQSMDQAEQRVYVKAPSLACLEHLGLLVCTNQCRNVSRSYRATSTLVTPTPKPHSPRPDFDPLLDLIFTRNWPNLVASWVDLGSKLHPIQVKIGSKSGRGEWVFGWGSSRPEWLYSSFEKLQN